ncbi:MAG TPA: adenylate/guanylate cyclase domain-containing protein [Flavobacteriales bacterium]|nr:adenylate/guanylate cyclase domain-containing protein [Flavobacteriales bacterium]
MTAAQRALSLFRPSCDSLVLMSINVNLSNTLLSLQEFDRVIAITESCLKQWNKNWRYSPARNGLFTNRAIALASKGDHTAALAAFRDVLKNAREERTLQEEADALLNLSTMFGMMAQQPAGAAFLDSTMKYDQLAIPVAKQLNDLQGVAILYNNLASTAHERHEEELALAYIDSSEVLARLLENVSVLARLADLKQQVYFSKGDIDSAYVYLRIHGALKDSLLNTEKVKAIADVQEKYESEKKAKEILGLKADNLEGELKQESMRRTRNIYLFAGIGTVLLAIGLYTRLRYVRRSREAIQKEKDISEDLLHNILPEEVAAELKAKGEAEAKLIDEVTVLFTDFKGFTAMSEKLSPKELVRDIHECFSAFDRIMEKHGIEKIKTIGDAYMAAGGLPIPNTTHATDVVKAALEIRDFINEGKALKIAKGLPFFEIRVGVHTGPVVAGIVGVKKFAYDIWGDTVNTASRMESSGSPGEVNISESTYQLIKNEKGFTFTERGKVSAKGKGELTMFFVDRSPS